MRHLKLTVLVDGMVALGDMDGDVHVRALTDDDVEELLSELQDSSPPHSPEGSLAGVEEFADRVLEVLKKMSRPADSPE